MEKMIAYSVQIVLTIVVSMIGIAYLRRSLYRVLVDLCKTEDRANFWMTFSGLVLMCFPLISSLGFNPDGTTSEQLFFEAANQMRGNLFAFVFGVLGIGVAVMFFAAISPRPAQPSVEPKPTALPKIENA